MKYDVIVIGAGLASLIAAAKAADRGKNVLLAASGMGSIGVSTGCIDILGYASNAACPVSDPWARLSELVQSKSEHPYAKAGLANLRDGLDFFCHVCNGLDYPYHSKKAAFGKANYLIPSSGGTLKASYLVPETMAGGDSEQSGDVLILGFKGLRDFHAQYIADKLNQHCAHGTAAVYQASELDMGLEQPRAVSAYDIALLMEKKEFRSTLAAKVQAGGRQYARIGLPGVLGLTKWREVREDLRTALGCELFEIPTLPPSVPGLRLYSLLMNQLKESGVRTRIGYPVRLGAVHGKRCTALELLSPGRSQTLSGDTYILGSGGILGGGIASDAAKILKESVFGLPVDQKPEFAEWLVGDSMIHGEHPIDLFGVEVNEHLQPVDRSGDVILENVHVVGRSLAHYAPFAELSGNGVAIATGYKAGLLA